MSGQIFRVPSFDRGAKKDERPLNDLPLDALPLSGKVRILDLSSGVKFKVLSMAATLPPMSAISTEESPSLLKKRRRKKKKKGDSGPAAVSQKSIIISLSYRVIS